MFERIRELFKSINDKDGEIHFDENDQRLAVAALLVHVMKSDGVTRDAERDAIKKSLEQLYELSSEELDELIKEGKEADESAVDFYSFTSVLKRELDREGLEGIVEMLWQVVLADGYVHELEDNVVWRVAELLGIETRDRVRARQRAEARLNAENG